MSMDIPTTLAMTWVERGKFQRSLSMPTKRSEWDYALMLAADEVVNCSGVYRRQGLIINSVRFGLLDSSGYPVPWPSGMRVPKI